MVAPQRPPTGPAPGDPLAGLPARIVFFDGVCVVCNRSVDWLLRHDARGLLTFAPLQGETAARVRAAFPGRVPEGLDSIVYLDRSGEAPALWLRARAVRRILETLRGGTAPAWLRWVPAPVADLAYRLFARARYALFGRRDACRVPTPEERLRFLP